MAQYVFQMQRVSKIVPPKKAILRDVSLSFFPGAKIGVLGLNGAGKSTLLRIMAGIDTDIEGEAVPQKGLRIGFLSQEPQLDPDKDVRGNVEEGLGEAIKLIERFNEISMKFAEPMDDDEMNALLEEQGQLQNAIDACSGWEVERKLEIAADALRLPGWDEDVTTLSGGERRRVALCRLLLSEPEMLLLDEPTNHLDAESVAWLERYLENYPGTVVAVTHDRYFLDNVAGWILELDRGHGIPWEGNYSSWLQQKDARLQQEEREEAAHKKTVSAELEWVRQGARGRQTKSRARLQRFEELQSKEFQQRNETNEIYIPPGPRLGDIVIEATELTKAFGDRMLMEDLTFTLPPGGIVGVVGANGAGEHELQSRAYCGRFNFKGQDQQKRIGQLSGGERNRVHLAKVLLRGGNVLFLDEPTNDLDIETLRALEEALLNFPGCVIVISHDRWFLDRIATHMLAFEGDSHVEWFPGNYADYEVDRRKRVGGDVDAPHRIKFKPVTR